jgi:hypothetical protein
MAKKLWEGRFSEKTTEGVEAFTASIGVDKRLYAYDIAGSIAHCKTLAQAAVISNKDADNSNLTMRSKTSICISNPGFMTLSARLPRSFILPEAEMTRLLWMCACF